MLNHEKSYSSNLWRQDTLSSIMSNPSVFKKFTDFLLSDDTYLKSFVDVTPEFTEKWVTDLKIIRDYISEDYKGFQDFLAEDDFAKIKNLFREKREISELFLRYLDLGLDRNKFKRSKNGNKGSKIGSNEYDWDIKITHNDFWSNIETRDWNIKITHNNVWSDIKTRGWSIYIVHNNAWFNIKTRGWSIDIVHNNAWSNIETDSWNIKITHSGEWSIVKTIGWSIEITHSGEWSTVKTSTWNVLMSHNDDWSTVETDTWNIKVGHNYYADIKTHSWLIFIDANNGRVRNFSWNSSISFNSWNVLSVFWNVHVVENFWRISKSNSWKIVIWNDTGVKDWRYLNSKLNVNVIWQDYLTWLANTVNDLITEWWNIEKKQSVNKLVINEALTVYMETKEIEFEGEKFPISERTLYDKNGNEYTFEFDKKLNVLYVLYQNQIIKISWDWVVIDEESSLLKSELWIKRFPYNKIDWYEFPIEYLNGNYYWNYFNAKEPDVKDYHYLWHPAKIYNDENFSDIECLWYAATVNYWSITTDEWSICLEYNLWKVIKTWDWSIDIWKLNVIIEWLTWKNNSEKAISEKDSIDTIWKEDYNVKINWDIVVNYWQKSISLLWKIYDLNVWNYSDWNYDIKMNWDDIIVEFQDKKIIINKDNVSIFRRFWKMETINQIKQNFSTKDNDHKE